MTKIENHELCPICDIGHLIVHNDDTFKFRYARKEYVANGLVYVRCGNCNTKTYLTGQREYNKKLIEEFQKTLVTYMSPSDILALREKYNLPQSMAAKIFGGGVNAFSKWERGEVIPSEPTAKIMRLALNNPAYMKDLADLSGVAIESEAKPIKDRRQQPNTRWLIVARDIAPHASVESIYRIYNPTTPSETHVTDNPSHVSLRGHDPIHRTGDVEYYIHDDMENEDIYADEEDLVWTRSTKHLEKQALN